MQPSVTHARRTGSVLAGCAVLLLGAAAPAGAGHSELAVQAVEIRGQEVRVVLANPGGQTRMAKVTVRVRLADGSEVAATSTATVFGRQKAFVHFVVGAPVERAAVLRMIVDDPTPF